MFGALQDDLRCPRDDFETDSRLSPVGVLLRGSLLQCHHQLEPLLFLPVLPATSAVA